MTDRAPDHQRISFTAKLVALGRAVTEIPFAREVSDLVGAAAVGADLAAAAGTSSPMPPMMAPLVEARYLSLVSAIKRSRVRQVLELASGVSLRGLAMTLETPTLTYVETDLAELTAEKLAIMNGILADRGLAAPPGHHTAVANVLVWDEIERAFAPLTAGEPVAVVHEGLFMYLSAQEKTLAAQNIARVLDRFGGVWITPDLSPMTSLAWLQDGADAELQKILGAIEARTGRSFGAHSFASEREAQLFCQRLGFSVEIRSQIDGTFVLSSLPGDHPETLAKMRDGLKLWEMRRA